MVVSKLVPDIHYDETRHVRPEDQGLDASVYSMDDFDRAFLITLGKPIYTHASRHHVIYVPIYLVNLDNTIDGQIGVYEYRDADAVRMLDAEGDFDLDRLPPPLWFAFAAKMVQGSNSDLGSYLTKWETGVVDDASSAAVAPSLEVVSPDDDDEEAAEDIMRLPKSSLATEEEKPTVVVTKALSPLPTETAAEADQVRAEYKPSPKHAWIQTYMQNPHYGIVNVEDNGDCFFAVVREAYRQRGYKTTVAELRARLAREMTDAIYQENRQLYVSLATRIKDLEQQMARIKKTIDTDLKKRYQQTRDAAQRSLLRREVESLAAARKDLADERAETEQLIEQTTGDLRDLDTFAKYRDYMQTSRYWADTWAISTLERLLRMKVVIFSEQAYDEGDLQNVLNCGEVNAATVADFQPEFYILTTYSGNHYRTITYRDRKLLTFDELPYHIKIMIVNKCFERDAGVYYQIPEFREFKARLGIDPDLGAPSPITTPENSNIATECDPVDEALARDWYDPQVVLRFHAKSASTPAPGKGSGEMIPPDHVDRYVPLKKHKEWRRKLDDAWIGAPFKVGTYTYPSVTHYYQAAKFMHGFPDFAQLFTVESGSDIAKDVALAKVAGGKTGQGVRPPAVVMDPDFYPARCHQERVRALTAKFGQHPDLQRILLDTQRAKLARYLPKQPAEPDVELMQLRAAFLANQHQRPSIAP